MHVACASNSLIASISLVCLALLAAPHPASAQPVDVPPTWGGDFLSRPRLTGDWGGLRDELGKKGVVLDMDLLLTPQGVLSGGRSTGANLWGNIDYTINVDTGKAGLWPGGFFKFVADTGFGSNVFRDSGTLVPINTAALIPAPNDRTTVLMNATFMQFLSTKFGLFAGKINTLDSTKQEFYGDYSTQFMNTAFLMPMTLATVPISAYGGGIIYLPQEDVTLSLLAIDPNGTTTNNSVGDAFDSGVLVLGSGQLTIKPFGLVGHQNLSFTWGNEERNSLTQDPSNIALILARDRFPRLANPGPILTDSLERFFPALLTPTQPLNKKNSSWTMNYSFDQYFWQPDGNPKHGIGMFFSFGASDGNPNPVSYSFTAGIGGNGVVPGRPDDNFGIGLARTELSDDFVPFLRQQLGLGLHHEDAVEMYYNAAITPWLSATADLQIVGPALERTLDRSSPSRLQSNDTAAVAGVRLRTRF